MQSQRPLDDPEVRLHALHDGIQESTQHGEPGRDATAEVHAVRLLHTGHEGGVAGNIGQQKITVAGR